MYTDYCYLFCHHFIHLVRTYSEMTQMHDDIVMEKVCNPDHPTQLEFIHKFASCH